ncbi:MAG: lysophospholipid acyltransferase family protein [Saprospiraceae bacterium]
MKTLRLAWRLCFFLVYTLLIVIEIWLRTLLHGADLRAAMRVRRRWARRLLHTVGIRLEITGTPPDFPALVVANHRSYVDPILLLCDLDALPVAKAELASWPVLGKGAASAGILYLRRESSGSRAQTLRQIELKIETGFPVILFPEGTTSGLPGTLPFKKGAFLMAARSGIPVVPVALCFADERDFWVGTEGFLSHAARRFREKTIPIRLCYGPAFQNSEPEALMHEVQGWINTQIGKYPPLNFTTE